MRRHVRTWGDDILGTGALASPYKTVQKAVSVSATGDTVDVGDGAFAEVLNVGAGIRRLYIESRRTTSISCTSITLNSVYTNLMFRYGTLAIDAIYQTDAFVIAADAPYDYFTRYGIVVFDECEGRVNNADAAVAFYHSRFNIATVEPLHIVGLSSVLEFSEVTWLLCIEHFMFRRCRLSVSTTLDCMSALSVSDTRGIKIAGSAAADTVWYGAAAHDAPQRDSAWAMPRDNGFEYLGYSFDPLGAENGPYLSLGIDITASREYHSYLYFYGFQDDCVNEFGFTTGAHVGPFEPTNTQQYYSPNSTLARYMLGLIPDSVFVPQEMLCIQGILDDYRNNTVRHVWPENDARIRNFIRVLATYLCRVSGSVVASFLGLMQEINSNWLDELNRRPTWRCGHALWRYDPATLQISFDADLHRIPVYRFWDGRRFNVIRPKQNAAIALNAGTLATKPWVALYLNIDVVADAETRVQYFVNGTDGYRFLLSRWSRPQSELLPMALLKVDPGTGQIRYCYFFIEARIDAGSSPIVKEGDSCYRYVTKSRTLLWHNDVVDPATWVGEYFVDDMYRQAFAADTRIFRLFFDDTVEKMGIIDKTF